MHIEKVHTDENGSNTMTKCLPRENHEACKQKVDLVVATTGDGWGEL